MPGSQPQVARKVNSGLLAQFNLRLQHPGMTPIGQVIVDALKRLGRSQEWLAEEMGVTPQAISKWVRQGGQVSRARISQLAEKLGVSPGALLGAAPSVVSLPGLGAAPGQATLDDAWNSYGPELKAQIVATVAAARSSVGPPRDQPRAAIHDGAVRRKVTRSESTAARRYRKRAA